MTELERTLKIIESRLAALNRQADADGEKYRQGLLTKAALFENAEIRLKQAEQLTNRKLELLKEAEMRAR